MGHHLGNTFQSGGPNYRIGWCGPCIAATAGYDYQLKFEDLGIKSDSKDRRTGDRVHDPGTGIITSAYPTRIKF